MNNLKFRLFRIIITTLLFATIIIVNNIFTFNINIIFTLYILIYLIISYDIIIKAVKNILRGKVFDENFLMFIASTGAFIIGDYNEAVAVMLFYQVGELFQTYAVGKSRKSIADLMKIKPEKATVLRNGIETIIEPEMVTVGDVLIVKNGEKIPVDGVLIDDCGCFDTSALTGESMPVNCLNGDCVLSGSINVGSVVKIKCEKEYYDSTVSKILDLVESVSGKKAKAENFISKFARFYTPIIVCSALLLFLIPTIITGLWKVWLIRACTFLVVSCPCALVISVPLGFFGGIGGASKLGILVKGGNYLELFNNSKTIVFDKTGTLTKGNFEVVEVVSIISKQDFIDLVVTCEQGSNHPIAKCILPLGKPLYGYKITEVFGKGIIAKNDQDVIICGSYDFMKDNLVNCEKITSDYTAIYVSHNGVFIGYILLGDVIKSETQNVICELKKCGIKTVMFTGDNKQTALRVAKQVGVDECFYELLPLDKVNKIEELLLNKKNKEKIVFVGDGINDAPVIMRADIGVSMGGIGSDSAIEASDVVLMYDDLTALLKAKKIAKKTVSIVKQNIVFALFVKISVLVLSVFGLTGMWAAVFADVGVAVLAILNSMRTMNIK